MLEKDDHQAYVESIDIVGANCTFVSFVSLSYYHDLKAYGATRESFAIPLKKKKKPT